MKRLRISLFFLIIFCLNCIAYGKQYDVGANDKEISIGNTAPYSGAATIISTVPKVEEAYFKKMNEEGGVNGRKIIFLSRDDGYTPIKTVEKTKQLIEQDKVLFIFSTIGTATNSAIQTYLNDNKIPQLFVGSGADRFNQPTKFPWSMAWPPQYKDEAKVYAYYVLNHIPNAKVAVLYQNDDYGKDYLKGFQEGLGAKASSIIVKTLPFNATDPSIASQIVNLKASGANVFLDIAIAKFEAQAVKEMHKINWAPIHFISSVSSSRAGFLQPVGYQNVQGIITIQLFKEPIDPKWKDDAAVKDYLAFMKKYYPAGDVNDYYSIYGYSVAQTMMEVLKNCKDDLTRSNIMKQAASLKLKLPMLLPDLEIDTTPTDYRTMRKFQLAKFEGENWTPIGAPITLAEINPTN